MFSWRVIYCEISFIWFNIDYSNKTHIVFTSVKDYIYTIFTESYILKDDCNIYTHICIWRVLLQNAIYSLLMFWKEINKNCYGVYCY